MDGMSKSDERSRHSFKASGKADRIGMSLADLLRLFPDDITSEALFEDIRWPHGTVCQHFSGERIIRVRNRKPMPLLCNDCRKFFSVRYGTVMQDSNLGLLTWLLAFYLFPTGLKGTSSLKLRRDLEVAQKTVCFLAHRIREAMRQDDPLFSGPAEADETYVGGLKKNNHKDKRMKAPGGLVGRAIVAGVRDRESRQISARVVPDTTSDSLVGMVQDHAEHGAMVYTDEAKGYLPLRKHGYGREAAKHSVSEYVRDQARTSGMESHWATLKRSNHGVYHWMSHGLLHRYVDEFQCRHNERPQDTIVQMAELIRCMDGRELTYKELIAEGPRANRDRVAS